MFGTPCAFSCAEIQTLRSAQKKRLTTRAGRQPAQQKHVRNAEVKHEMDQRDHQAFKLDEVRVALEDIGVRGLTVTEVKGFGRQKGHTEIYRGAEYQVSFLPKTRIDIAVRNDQLDAALAAIEKSGRHRQDGRRQDFCSGFATSHPHPHRRVRRRCPVIERRPIRAARRFQT